MADQEEQRVPGTGEEEPLLGRPGDASQREGKPLYHNFVIGWSVGGTSRPFGDRLHEDEVDREKLAAIVWGAVFTNDLILFSAHPLLNSAALLFLVQGILILQPTHTAKQKREGTYTHAALNDVGLLFGIAGLVVIEYNKIAHNGTHFVSVHAILGLITYILIIIQTIVGITQYFTPGLYGGVDNAKKLYKYHRISGYVVLLLILATVSAATQTDFNKNVLGIQLWAVIIASVLILVGVLPRIKLNKFGWLAGK